MPNIQFNYLYRDGGNYKNWGSVVFANPDNYSLAEAEAIIKRRLIDEEFFYAEEWGLPDLRGDISIDDPTWHEYVSLEFTDDAPDTCLSSLTPLPVILPPNPNIRNKLC